MLKKSAIIFVAIVQASVGQAADSDCPKDHVCASRPETLVEAMQEEGYKAQLGKDDIGEPKISSKANGYNFGVYFYDCTEKKDCKAIQFNSSFAAADDQTAEYANKWNKDKRL